MLWFACNLNYCLINLIIGYAAGDKITEPNALKSFNLMVFNLS